MDKLWIAHTVAYMLKVMKSGADLSQHRKPFASIRHGNYDDFIDEVDGELPFMIVYNAGNIEDDVNKISQKTHFDFAGLIKAGPSMKKFYYECFNSFGRITDPDIPDQIFEDVALFEIGLRMHANNNELLDEREEFEGVINKLSDFKNLTLNEKEALHQGRKFLNMIKHGKLSFPSWDEGIQAFLQAKQIQLNHKLTVQ